MTNEHRSVLSDRHQADSLPGQGYLLVARWLIFIERNLRLCWRFYCVLGVFLALAWFGLFERLPPFLHFVVLAVIVATVFYSLRGTGSGWRIPSLGAAARRLEIDSKILHRPYDALVSKPVNTSGDDVMTDAMIKALWRQHQLRARALLKQVRLPRIRLRLGRHDRWALRYIVPLLVIIAAATGWGELKPRLVQAVTVPSAKRMLLASGVELDGWITPPAFTKLPPVLLAQSSTGHGAPTPADGVILVPAGSKIAMRVNLGQGESWSSVPSLRAGEQSIAFAPADDGGYTLDIEVPDAAKLAVTLGWRTLGSWRIKFMPDQPPSIAWRAPPSIDGSEIVLDYEAHDDYGVAKVTAVVNLAVSAPGLPTKPFRASLPGAGQKDIDGKNRLDLSSNPWTGMPVTFALEAADQNGQVAHSDPVTLTLPERVFTHPVAQMLAAARKKFLINPTEEWRPTTNLLAGIAHQPKSYGSDPVIQLALRSAAMRLYLDRKRAYSLGPVADIMWRVALRLDMGGLEASQEQLRAAQRRLEEALANHADAATIKRLTNELQQAMAQYLQDLAQKTLNQQDGIPEELQEDVGQDVVDDIMKKTQEIQDLAATGSREAAQQKLQELQKMLEELSQAKPLTQEQRADIESFKQLKQIIAEQQRLQKETGKQDVSPPQAGELGKQQEQLREKLGQMAADYGARHPDVPPQLATADQAMKAAGKNLQQQELPEAQNQQGKSLQALKELSKNMQDSMKIKIMRMSAGRKGERNTGQRDPFAPPEPTNEVDDDSVKIPDQQKIKRAREILDELRRRSGDYSRPREERDYIDRLLNSF